MATKDDVIQAWTQAGWPVEIIQQMRGYLDANASNYTPASYDDIVNTGLQIGNQFFRGQSTALWSLTTAEQQDIGNTINAMWTRQLTRFAITTLTTGKWSWHMEYDGAFAGDTWIFYSTPSGEPTMMPALMAGTTLQNGYLPVYKDSNLVEYSWFADSSASGNPLQIGDIITPVDTVATLYAGIPTPSKIVQMNNKITENNNEVRYKIYPITKASAVYLNNGDTVETAIGDVETALSTINTTLGGMV